MPERHYKRNFLSRVILRVDYDTLAALQSQQRSELSDRIKNDYPIVNGTPVGSLVVNVSPTGSGIQQQIMGMQWEHRKVQGGTKVLFFTPDHLSLEYGQGDFDHFPPFRAEFDAAFDALSQLYSNVRVTRIGLRYVNQVRFEQGNALDWDELLAPHLVAATKAGIPNNASLVRSMHQLHVRQNNLSLLLHYGIFNPEYPAAVSRREFVLDIDSHRSELTPNNEVLAIIADLNETCETTFEACILDGLRAQMEPINE